MQWCQATDTVEVTSIPSGVTHTTKKGRGPVSDSLRLLTPGKASGCSKIQQQLCILRSIRVTFHLFSVLNFWHYHHHHHRFTAIIQVNLHLQLSGQQHLHTLADGNQCIRIREKTLEFSLSVLSTLSPYLNASYITHTHTRWDGPFSGTTQVSRHQKSKTNLDFTEARDSEWQWHQLGHMQVCTLLQTDNHASTRPLIFFTGRLPFLSPNQQRQSTEGILQLQLPVTLKWQ